MRPEKRSGELAVPFERARQCVEICRKRPDFGPVQSDGRSELNQGRIEETGTELERVLAYYKLSALGEMSEASYSRALELLKRKLGKQGQGGGVHAQN